MQVLPNPLASTRERGSAPIHRLIPEILHKIFELLRDTNDAGSWIEQYYYPGMESEWSWIILSQVCRYWRSVALEFSLLWSHLLNFRNIKKTNVFLERSRKAPLKVCSIISFNDKMNNARKLNCLIRALLHMDRICYLELKLNFQYSLVPIDNMQKINRLLSRSSPRLQKIKLKITSDVPFNSLPSRFPENAPHLTSLSLENFSWPANMAFPTNLTELVLSSVRGLTFQNFLRTLEICSGLKVLSIKNIRWIEDANLGHVLTRRTVISLPNLCELNVDYGDDGAEAGEELSRVIQIPDTASSHWCYYGSKKWKPLLRMNSFVNFIKNSSLSEVIEVRIMPRGIYILSQHSTSSSKDICKTTVEFSCFDPTFPTPVLSYTAPLFSACQWKRIEAAKLTLYLGSDIIAEEHWYPLLSAISQIHILEIIIEEEADTSRNSKSNTEIFLEVLLRGGHASKTDGVIFCERLKFLFIKIDEGTPDNLANILRNGLQNRTQTGTKLDTLFIHTDRSIEGAQSLEDFAMRFSYSFDVSKLKNYLERDYDSDDDYMFNLDYTDWGSIPGTPFDGNEGFGSSTVRGSSSRRRSI